MFTDIFTGAPGVDAADKNKQLLDQTKIGIADRTQATKNMAGGFLNTGYNQAGNNLSLGYDAAGNAIKTGATGALGYIDQGYGGAVDQFGQARADYGKAGAAYTPLTDLAGSFRNGSNLYADAMGINGAEGNTRANGAFTAGPGYQFALNTGLDSVNRAANARGMANSGNTDVDALKFGTGLADQTYKSWLAGLAPYNGYALSATQGAAAGNADAAKSSAGVDLAQAGLAANTGAQRAGIATGQGTTLADIANKYYAGLAGNNVTQGSALAGNETGANQLITGSELNLVPQVTQQNTTAANAQMAGSGNLWNLGIQGLKAAAGAAGGMGGGGSFTNLGNFFSPAGWNSSVPAGSLTGV